MAGFKHDFQRDTGSPRQEVHSQAKTNPAVQTGVNSRTPFVPIWHQVLHVHLLFSLHAHPGSRPHRGPHADQGDEVAQPIVCPQAGGFKISKA